MSKLYFDTALLPGGWADRVLIEIDPAGVIAEVSTGVAAATDAERAAIGIPGLPNLHSHAFQRGMAGLAEIAGPTEDSFWTWRQVMYRFLERLAPDDVEAIAGQLFVEMLEAGFTSVGEFHYLHHCPDGGRYDDPAEMATRIAAATATTGIGLTLLPVFYANGGFGGQPIKDQQRRFASTPESFGQLVEGARRAAQALPHAEVGVAPHSLRAVTPECLSQIVRDHPVGPIHIHVAEQTKEVEDCLAWSGKRPVDWLLAHHDVDPRWCLIHATHMQAAETAALARSGAVAGLCPITEANLGDGHFDGVAYLAAGGRFGVGSDSHVRVDAAEELRLLEYGQRLRDRRRNVFASDGQSSGRLLFEQAARGGAQALGRKTGALSVGNIADIVALDSDHPTLAGRSCDALLDGWIFAGDGRCVQHVWVAGQHMVADGRHRHREAIGQRFAATLRKVLA